MALFTVRIIHIAINVFMQIRHILYENKSLHDFINCDY